LLNFHPLATPPHKACPTKKENEKKKIIIVDVREKV